MFLPIAGSRRLAQRLFLLEDRGGKRLFPGLTSLGSNTLDSRFSSRGTSSITLNSLPQAGFRQEQVSVSQRILPWHTGQRRRSEMRANGEADPFRAETPLAAGRFSRTVSSSPATDNCGADCTQRKIGNMRGFLHGRTQLHRGRGAPAKSDAHREVQPAEVRPVISERPPPSEAGSRSKLYNASWPRTASRPRKNGRPRAGAGIRKRGHGAPGVPEISQASHRKE